LNAALFLRAIIVPAFIKKNQKDRILEDLRARIRIEWAITEFKLKDFRSTLTSTVNRDMSRCP
jgi:hypothetical protein